MVMPMSTMSAVGGVTGSILDPPTTDLVVEFVMPNGLYSPDMWRATVGQNAGGEIRDIDGNGDRSEVADDGNGLLYLHLSAGTFPGHPFSERNHE